MSLTSSPSLLRLSLLLVEVVREIVGQGEHREYHGYAPLVLYIPKTATAIVISMKSGEYGR